MLLVVGRIFQNHRNFSFKPAECQTVFLKEFFEKVDFEKNQQPKELKEIFQAVATNLRNDIIQSDT